MIFDDKLLYFRVELRLDVEFCASRKDALAYFLDYRHQLTGSVVYEI